MPEKCPKNVRQMSKECPNPPANTIFRTFVAYLVTAFVWQLCPMHACYNTTIAPQHTLSRAQQEGSCRWVAFSRVSRLSEGRARRDSGTYHSAMGHYYWDPECLLRGSRNLKVPKVDRRGCKGVSTSWRSGRPGVSCTSATLSCTSATLSCTNATGIWSTCTKAPFAPSPNHFGHFSGPCSRHSGTQHYYSIAHIWGLLLESFQKDVSPTPFAGSAGARDFYKDTQITYRVRNF